MKTCFPRILAVCLLAFAGSAFVFPVAAQVVIRPGAPGEPSTVVTEQDRDERAPPAFTEADVRFMQGMIPHHAQALDMTALLADRTDNPDLHLIAERIEVSQTDEIAWMQRWLTERGEEAPAASAHHHHGGHGEGDGPMLMPGMLTPAEMAELAAATGTDFDRLFLEFMISHHEGALVMVADLLGSEGAAQASEVFRFAADIDADQRAEIRRMQAMLNTLSDDG